MEVGPSAPFGMLLVNIYPDIMAKPYVDAMGIEHAGGLLHYFFLMDEWSILPSLIFMGVGAMTDFGPADNGNRSCGFVIKAHENSHKVSYYEAVNHRRRAED